MGLFKKKKTVVDLDETFKQKYKTLNGVMQNAQEELDYTIKASSYQLVIEKYNELLELIDQGANFDRAHFETLKASVEKELEMIQSL